MVPERLGSTPERRVLLRGPGEVRRRTTGRRGPFKPSGGRAPGRHTPTTGRAKGMAGAGGGSWTRGMRMGSHMGGGVRVITCQSTLNLG